MTTATTSPRHDYLEPLEPIISQVIAPAAVEVDRTGSFPRAALDSLGQAGLLGLVSAKDVGGLGEGIRAATLVVEQIAKHCASTAMVVCMHYAAAAVIESVLGSPVIPEVSVTSTTAPGVTHRWTNLGAFSDEIANARIWAGFHYRFSVRVGQDMGRSIGQYVVKNVMQPLTTTGSR